MQLQSITGRGLSDVEVAASVIQTGGAGLCQGVEPGRPESAEPANILGVAVFLLLLFQPDRFELRQLGHGGELAGNLFVAVGQGLDDISHGPIFAAYLSGHVEGLLSGPKQRSQIQQHPPGVVDQCVGLLFTALHILEQVHPVGGVARCGLAAPPVALGVHVLASPLMDGFHLPAERRSARRDFTHDALTDFVGAPGGGELAIAPLIG
ncbi:hypothetical protein D9M70_517000 [compost metagenome]